jgi:hypothetical protein
MEKRKLSLKWVALIITLIVLANLGYNFFNPSMDKVINLAEYEWKYFANQNYLKMNDFKGPVIDLGNDRYYIFRWERAIKNDSINIYEVSISKNHSEEPFVTGE